MKNRRIMLTAVFLLLAAGSIPSGIQAEELSAERAGEVQPQQTGDVSEAEQSEVHSDLIASADEMSQSVEVVSEEMTAVYADSLKEGTYPIEVLCSSSMFAIQGCELTVSDGELIAFLTMESDSYLKLFLGTGQEAVEASEEDCITFELNEEGKQVYQIPVKALDVGIDCAAWSRRKEKWYERILVFSASSLPMEAFQNSVILTAGELGLEDGTYTVEAVLEGGSGKTTIDSPVTFTVDGDQVIADLTINSPHYDYVMVGNEKFPRLNKEGDSSFRIPVNGFDWKIPIVADSVAMGTPHEIDYTLYFDSSTIQKAE